MSSLAKILQVNSDQHKELSVSRKRRDKFDLQKDGTEAINCDDGKTAGEIIQKPLGYITVGETKISKKDRTKTMNKLRTGIVINAKRVHIDRLIHTFFYIRNVLVKAPGLNLGKKLSNFLSNREALN